MKNGYDVAVPPNPTPELDFACGYVYQAHHEATHLWTVAEWDRARSTSRWLLPIATCWTPFGDPSVDARNAVGNWVGIVNALGLHGSDGYAFALDMEISVAESPGALDYANGWRQTIRDLDLYDIVYSSASAIPNLGDGPTWTFGTQNLLGYNDIVAVQTGQTTVNGTIIDTDVALDTVPFFDTQAEVDVPSPVPFLFRLENDPHVHAVYLHNGINWRWLISQTELDTWLFILKTTSDAIPNLTLDQIGGSVFVGPNPH